jgi:hypothetical protein
LRPGIGCGNTIDRGGDYSQSVRKILLTAIIVGALLGAILLVSIAQNDGCLPWKERVGIGGSPFSENRGTTQCR